MKKNRLKKKQLKVLVIAYWPLGGIRTYMKYLYKYISKDSFDITILASKTHEEKALYLDAQENNCKLSISKTIFGRSLLFFYIFRLLMKERFGVKKELTG